MLFTFQVVSRSFIFFIFFLFFFSRNVFSSPTCMFKCIRSWNPKVKRMVDDLVKRFVTSYIRYALLIITLIFYSWSANWAWNNVDISNAAVKKCTFSFGNELYIPKCPSCLESPYYKIIEWFFVWSSWIVRTVISRIRSLLLRRTIIFYYTYKQNKS